MNCRPPGPKPGALPLGHAPEANCDAGTVTGIRNVERTMKRRRYSDTMVPPERIELSSLAPEASTLIR